MTVQSVISSGPVDAARVLDLLQPPRGACRVKGTIEIHTGRSHRVYVVHVVGRHSHLRRILGAASPASELVAIGTDLDRNTVRDCLERDLAPARRSTSEAVRRLERLRRLSG